MKIALIVNPLIPVPPDKYGGIERIVFMLIQELMKAGHDVTLYANPESEPGCKLIGYNENERYGLADLIKINKLTMGIAFKGFDLVHTFGRMSNIALLMALKIPKVVSYQLPPTITQVKKAVQIAPAKSLHFTACSNFIANQISAYCSVSTIYNGVNLSDYYFNQTVAADAPLVFLGRIQREKGTDIAIRVAIKTGRKLIIAGNIPNEPHHQLYFEQEVKPHIDGTQIVYIGPVDNKQKNDLLNGAAAMLMPVTWDEPFGIVMAEALACGTPVLGFKRGAVPEVVINGYNGFVCNTVDEMIDEVHSLSLIDRANCRKTVEEKFSAEVLALQYQDLYKKVTSKL